MQTRLSPVHPDSGKVSVHQLEERIRERAFEIYESRGMAEGHELDDWLQAKNEILGVVKSSVPQEPRAA
jgi:Protein of unknown function (DUF2934)